MLENDAYAFTRAYSLRFHKHARRRTYGAVNKTSRCLFGCDISGLKCPIYQLQELAIKSMSVLSRACVLWCTSIRTCFTYVRAYMWWTSDPHTASHIRTSSSQTSSFLTWLSIDHTHCSNDCISICCTNICNPNHSLALSHLRLRVRVVVFRALSTLCCHTR